MTSNLKRLLAGAGVVLGLFPTLAYAQQATVISGRVTTEAGAPLLGASVSIPTMNVGAYTQNDGTYSFSVTGTSGQTVTVQARRLGYLPKNVEVTLNSATVTQNFELAASPTQLQGVVVSALGIEREKSRLGTAQQQIGTTELNQTKAMNVVQQIQGKVSGVQITGSGTQGGSTNIIIRGANSIAGNNQPLFVVDGIPVSNSNRGGDIIDGWDFGNAISDLNPNDIETFTILKGPNAAAIYGSRAANGVIVITTKKGSATGGRIRTELATTYTWERPSLLPDYQNGYGQGAGGDFSYVNGAGGGLNDGLDQSWGPKLDVPGRLIDQFTGPQQPWISHPDNVKNFFEMGHTLSTTVAASGGTDRANARLSVGVDNVDGYVPNNYFQKTSGLLSGNLKIGDRLTTTGTVQYIRNNGRNRAGTGYYGSIMEQFFWFGRQVDIDALQNWQRDPTVNNGPPGREFNWNYNYHNNPYFLQYGNVEDDSRDRFIVSGTANYQITDWATATLRSGSDIFRFNIDREYASGNIPYTNLAYAGGFAFTNDYRNENNTDLLLTADRQLLSNLSLNAMAGVGTRREHFTTNSQSTAGLTVPGIYTVTNAAIAPTLGQQLTRRQVNSAYGSAAFTYNNWWTVEGTARNDWSSTLPADNNSYFYPSVNTSIILTEAIPALRSNALSYLKVRGSIAQVGNDADPYQLRTTFVGQSNKYAGQPQFTYNSTLANAELKPEITRSSEAGVELGFFNGRASLDATYYSKETRNQIFDVTVSSTSGFASKSINAGKITNKGFEGLLTVTPVQLSNTFQWTTTFNIGTNKNRVAALTPDVTNIVLGTGIFADSRLEARVGQPYGAIYGSAFARNDNGDILVQNNGLPLPADTFVYLGTIQPDWTGGWNNQLSYKNFSLGVLFDIRQGGKIVSYTNEVGDYSGVLESSLRGREIDWNNPGIIVKGVNVNTGQPNDVTLTAEKYFQSIFPTIEPYVYDASYVKLRELRFGYDLPTNLASRLHAENVSLAITGRNLALWTDVPNIDPEFAYSSGNYQGVEYAIPANPRSIGISLRVTP